MILTLAIFICLMVSMMGNLVLGTKLQNRILYAPVKIEYKEIEVVKRAVCECTHVSSVHKSEAEGGCQQELHELDGYKSKVSFKCYCARYVGPEPYTDFFDAGIRELETLPYKEIENARD